MLDMYNMKGIINDLSHKTSLISQLYARECDGMQLEVSKKPLLHEYSRSDKE